MSDASDSSSSAYGPPTRTEYSSRYWTAMVGGTFGLLVFGAALVTGFLPATLTTMAVISVTILFIAYLVVSAP